MRESEELEEKFAALDRIIHHYGGDRGQLIRVLQEAQDVFGYLPEEVQTYIAGKMDMPVSEVNGVVTFYALFATEPRGRFSINVCTGTACYVQGAQNLLEDFKRDLSLTDHNTTPDGLFTVKSTRCIGACGLAPVLTVNDEVHGKLTRKDVSKLLRTYKRIGTQKAEVKEIDRVPAGLGTDQEQPPSGR